MPKIYVKTIILTVLAVILVELRLNLLAFTFDTIPSAVYDILTYACILAIVINEKFTKSERWVPVNYLGFLCLISTGILTRMVLWQIAGA